ncbi:histone-lysine N-methyltransferase ATXR3 [Malania oleifera]|uniref:histone-lysine N-methyltransferase ATXR3 n=1 Tax=Malania oleifera TaxID=397392 RepID=UPI0025AE3FB8|nr:histone-lysine N-methyltransferase ATXR3 [Malania oleifera]
MGDGGVACVPLQNLMERFSIAEKLCGGNNGGGSGTLSSKSLKFTKKKMKLKKDEAAAERGKKEVGVGGDRRRTSGREVENGEICIEKTQKEEVEEGELGTLKWSKGEVENGEAVLEKSRKSEIEKGEIVADKWRKGDVEKGEIDLRKGGKVEIENGEIVPEKNRKCESEKVDFGSWRGSKDELEKGEFIPERLQRGEVGKDAYSNSKMRRHDAANKEKKGWKYEPERMPPSGKHSGEGKDFIRGGSQHSKRSSSRWDTGQEKNFRLSSKIVDEEGSLRNEHSNGKNYDREYSLSGNRLKRHASSSEFSERKHHGEFGDYTGSKSRRLSDDSSRTVHSDLYSRRSVERPYKNSSKTSSSDRYSSRHYDSSLSSRVVYDRHGRSPGHSERSPRDRARYDVHRGRSPSRRDRSPYDHRHRSPAYKERSPPDRARHRDRRDHTPNYIERSPHEWSRPNNARESSRKSGAGDKRHSQHGNKGQEDKLNQKESRGKDSHFSAKESHDRSSVRDGDGPVNEVANSQSHKDEQSQSPSTNCKEPLQVSGAPEEPSSMEEDMDICDTPPHVSVTDDSTTGKWFYLDHLGMERGPSKLCDLKRLVEDGVLVSDHLIKNLDSDRWVTVENAVSPLVTVHFPPIVSDSVTQLVSPPEAPGNLLADTGDIGQSCNHLGEEALVNLPPPSFIPDHIAAVSEPLEDLQIDERVGALLKGFTVLPGKELETLGEALQMIFDHAPLEGWVNSEGFTGHVSHNGEQFDQKTDDLSRYSDSAPKVAAESRSNAYFDKDFVFTHGETPDWFLSLWSCKGGDWKRNDEAAQDKSSRKKLVLNDGFPLCQMPKSGYEDPRWHRKDELYYPSHSRRLDLPPWAFSWSDERNDCNSVSRSSQIKSVFVRGVKGIMQPVVRINACVVKDYGSFVSEPRLKVRGKERHSSRSARPYSAMGDVKRLSIEGIPCSMTNSEQDLQCSWKCLTSINTPKDRVCTVDELQLHLGEWFYLDGAGHERGPLSFSELHVLVDKGIIQKNSSVFRKIDKVWVPVTPVVKASETATKIEQENNASSGDSSGPPPSELVSAAFSESSRSSSLFHSLHPQFIGYTRGKLHELVMKSYKSREFAAAINEVLDPWINAKQPRKEMEKHVFNSATCKSSLLDLNKFQMSDGDMLSAKRVQMLIYGNEEYEVEDVLPVQMTEHAFDDLCGDATFFEDDSACSETEIGTWGLLDGHMLARVFHFLRTDMKSLVFASLTCKHWRAAVRFYRDISRQVDLSSIGPSCTDSIMQSIMNGYNKERIASMVLIGCTNITSGMLEEILGSFPQLSSIDVRGCSQFGELAFKFPNVNWVKNHCSRGLRISEESHAKMKSLRHITEKTSSFSKNFKSLSSHGDDFSELRDYFDSVDKRDAANQSFRRSLYKRSKLFDARRSSSILSKDARIRQWAMKKSDNGYKRIEEFLAHGLKSIMKENTCDFFVPKVAEIEDRMKSGYYVGHGLNSVKEDISRMCRDALKAKNRGDAGGMNHIIASFIGLATHLEGNFKSSHGRDGIMRMWKDDSSAASKYKKKLNKMTTERKYMSKSNGTSFVNDASEYGEYSSDREIRRYLSKLTKKSMDSGSDTSDDHNGSSEDTRSDSERTASDTETDLDFRSEGRPGESRRDGYFMVDESFCSMTDDREWGARMTKASLVPPVTRKYEVIDQYVVVADEEDVQRKMQVSLPEDYAEKLLAQKNGTEESDMEIPEVKDFKPRKKLGDEVIEQEVYGIDPYTHNLLLDSMPDELDWPLLDKHLFIEDVLLRTLNKQVRHFTGTGNTPMMYHLRPVVEEIQKIAEEDGDVRTVRMCQGILKAMDSRRDDNYVAYRKGLGVVCNKDGGFSEDDFVVEFLGEVYPAWKWFEKQDGIRSLQKDSEDPAPEFYNIYLERPKGDADGYDLVVVDAMHKANYASRICHSCHPNCEAKVTAVDGQYQIGIYSVRPIRYGEEITFDYNSVTESKEEYEASVCLCGSQVCRGSYLNLTGEGAFQKVLEEWHGMLDRHQLMLDASEINSVSEEDYIDLGRAGLGSCLLGGLPDWLVAYSARLVRFINFERTKLPEEILRHNLEEKRKFFAEICLEVEKSDAEVQAEGVYNQRLQNLALTLDKVRYVMRCVFGDPKKAPPPIERLSPEATVSFLWKGEGSFVDELLQCMAPHMEESMLNELKSKIRAHDPSGSEDISNELQKSLLWLRDEVRNLPCTYRCRHDAAADLIHIYAYTKCFFRVREYKTVTSPPVYISPLDLGPKYSDKLGAGFQEYCKTYGESYCLGQLIYWYNQTYAEPDCTLARASRGCLSLPDVGSFYAKVQKPSRHRVYGPRTVRYMLARMEKQPQRTWAEDRIWSFKSSPKVFASPMLDTVLSNTPLDNEMVHWLKNRPTVFHAMWDQ